MAGYSLNANTGYYRLTGHPVQLAHGLSLDPGGPFFEYVLTFLCASAGFTPVYDAVNNPRFMAGILGVFPNASGNVAHVNLGEAVVLARDGTTLPQQRAEQRLCCMLANSAYESIAQADRDKLEGDPVYEFFRHVRNAASHGNEWHFTGTAPTRAAVWNGITLDKSMNGTTLIYGTIFPADLLHLLRDVEALLK